MIVTKIKPDVRNQLYMSLDKNLSSIKGRSVGYSIYTFSDTLATISITVSGKAGSVTKQVGIYFDALLESWTAYDNNNKYTLSGLSELNAIVKSVIVRQTTTVNKIS